MDAPAAMESKGHDDQQMNRAVVTMITDDGFKTAVEVLIFSLLHKRRTNAKIVVLVTPQVSNVTKDALSRNERVTLKEVEAIPNPASTSHVEGWINSGYTKLHIWNLVEYTRVLYIDADALVLENIDELFERNTNFAAAPDIFPPDKFNAGVLLIQPNKAIYSDLLSCIDSLPSYDGGDTGFLNSFFKDWYLMPSDARLPFSYNAQRTLHWLTSSKNPGYWNSIGTIKILHFSSNPKPWQTAKKGELEMLWWKFYLQLQMMGGLEGGSSGGGASVFGGGLLDEF